jgi:CDP-4-dehydro-6-deoxyglucose reductase
MDAATKTVTLANGRTFAALPGLSLLDAAAAHGLTLEHGCRTGRCGSCKATVTQGTTAVLRDETSLTEAERDAGVVLTCARGVATDVTLSIDDLGLPPGLTPRVVPARIDALERLADNVLRVTLRLPPNQPLAFAAGQYVDVTAPSGVRRSYSMAQAPAVTNRVELQIRRVDGGAMSDWWFSYAKQNDLVRLRGPLGTFFLRETANVDLVFLATGTGIAPIRAMLAQLAALDDASQRPASVRVFWGGRTPADLYLDPTDGLVHAGSHANPDAAANPRVSIAYTPVLSRADAAWQGARGHVQQALLQGDTALGPATRVYACGSPAMIDDARASLVAAGLAPRHFHSDAFVESNDAAAVSTAIAA